MSDRRSVATDALEVLGTIITDRSVGRDAIHLACMPVIASTTLTPGQHIGVSGNMAFPTGLPHVGIVDPFLTEPVQPYQEFLLVVYPRKIASLRHVWSHPDIPDEIEAPVPTPTPTISPREEMQQIANQIMANIGDNDPFDYHDLMDAMDDGYLSDGGRFEGCSALADMIPDRAWELFKEINGRAAQCDRNRDDVYFSCSC